MVQFIDYYKILQIDPSAGSDIIEAAFIRLSEIYKPIHGRNTEEKYKEITEAYFVLKDPNKKSKYDIIYKNFYKLKPKPEVDKIYILFDDVAPGEIKTDSFVLRNSGGDYENIDISVQTPNSWLKITGLNSLNPNQLDELPLRIELEANADEWDRNYIEYIIVKFDDEEIKIRVELNTKKRVQQQSAFNKKKLIPIIGLPLLLLIFLPICISYFINHSAKQDVNLIESTRETIKEEKSMPQESTILESSTTQNDITQEEANEVKTIVTYPEGIKDFSTKIFIVNADGSNCHMITPGEAPVLSPNGEYIAFNGYWNELWVAKVDGSSIIGLMNGTHPSWSPDSSQIVSAGYGSDNEWGVYVVDIDGGKPLKIFGNIGGGNVGNPDYAVWSPDGTNILVPVGGKIYTVNHDGSNPIILDKCFWYNISYFPDGGKILYYDDDFISVINKDGTNKKHLVKTDENMNDDEPKLSSDGSKILYSEPSKAIYTINSDGTNIFAVTSGNYYKSIYWSPNSNKILFWDAVDEAWFTINSDGMSLIKIADKSKHNPNFSPDGEKIVFWGYEGDYPYLYIINSDGSKTIKLSEANGYNPQWSIDGSKIIFTR